MNMSKTREIKFRAWNKKLARMFYFDGFEDIITFSDGGFIRLPDWDVYKDGFNDLATPDELEFLEYTGLKDKNGKEIYEGDIVSFSASGFRVFPQEVKYLGNGFWIEGENGEHFLPRLGGLEVIGNIYENPELLGANDV
jgi:uncharacterized phage protein (TIGR01671 family)